MRERELGMSLQIKCEHARAIEQANDRRPKRLVLTYKVEKSQKLEFSAVCVRLWHYQSLLLLDPGQGSVSLQPHVDKEEGGREVENERHNPVCLGGSVASLLERLFVVL